MKKSTAFLLTFIITLAVFAQTITVGSYNIRYKNSGDSIRGNAWSHRCPALCAQISWENPAIFGAQEVLHPQLLDITTLLPDYQWIGVGRDDGRQSGEYAPIFYRPDRLELLDHGHFWLSETPESPTLGWDAACIRICTWGYFRDRHTRQHFYFLNLHMDHVGTEARRQSAHLVLQRLHQLTADGATPAILTGDFNVSQTDELYRLFTQSGLLKDTYESAANRFAENGTFNSYSTDGYTTDRIDHILVSPSVAVDAYAVRTDGRWQHESDGQHRRRSLSDHYPVFARLRLAPKVSSVLTNQ